MENNFFWAMQALQGIVLGLGIPGLIVGAILAGRKQSIRKIELRIREKELQIEEERTRILLLEHENKSLDRQFRELEDRPST